ncbi:MULTISPECIES: hypothetical protein [unclassified Enterococcus]|uniref:hypothetical protein n=1 Tax=unclassified Enterococcus TaxID=2608891 RepID=UPI001555F658|nr:MULTISPECIES: hypothetical protein [unclassified Enterococcus]MBS7577481.1 hypothetical protein [Enterococcus sp. MMGLQ5-2]MBS7585020.1 hypothetical protein [Enterococcus sp. MMGLQ5-1]NPD12876.1 hypothetical protein [Enterococcus sp. MMGLQ5-1]NPD37313.1 hypothetical protein [Enterococcus sp. MMGLQ5-2]
MNKFPLKDWLTISISLFALLISAINFIRDWKRVSVSITKQGILKRIETFDMVQAYPDQSPGLCIEFRFINSSKYSIGYFDLVFRDGYTNELLPAFLKHGIRPEIASQELLGITLDEQVKHLNPMNSNYGMIPANSYLLNETVVHPISDKIRVNIKFAKFSIIPNFRSKTTKFKKHKSVLIKLSSEEITSLQREIELMK